MDLKVEDILKCANGNLIIGDKNKICKNYNRDTRSLNVGDTFVALKGDNFDGNTFWEEALENGADIVIMNRLFIDDEKKKKYSEQNKCIIQVNDTIEAIGKIAKFKRNLYKDKLKVIGVTGSVGKTSTKDIIANVLSEKYKTLKTQGNKNNFIGLPFTILELEDEEVAVIEMGMNHFEEISYLSKIAKPDIAVITNIGTAHIGILGSRENILKAKLEILDGMEDKIVVINNDNDLLNKWNTEKDENIKTYTYGIENKSDVNAENVVLNEDGSEFICKDKEEKIKINVPVAGEHFVLNSLCAYTVGKLLDLSNEQIINGIKKFKLTAKRMEIHKLKKNITIINDSYNASYESMKASITSLSNMTGNRKIAVLGDMFELGDFSEQLHRKVGDEIVNNHIDKLFLIGDFVKYTEDEVVKKGFLKKNILYFTTREELTQSLENEIKSGDIVLIKASNGMKLYEVTEQIKKYFE